MALRLYCNQPNFRFPLGETSRTPTDRRWEARKHHIANDAYGIPLAATLAGVNEHAVTRLSRWWIRARRSRRTEKTAPQQIQGNRAYDSHRCRVMARSGALNWWLNNDMPSMAAG
jgi:hypothetical protein